MKKEKRNNKAFTLIELLGVIILLSVIAIIAIVAVNKNIKDTQDTLKQVQLNNIKDGAKNWSTDNIKSIPNGKSIYLTLAQLKQGGYVEENIKSPGNDKLCFPNDLQIEIKSNESGSYEYNVLDSQITYISCEEDQLDSNAPRIVLEPGDEINDKNEVVDYVEVSQDAEGKYTVPVAYAYGPNGSDFNSTDSASFIASLNDSQYTPEIDSNIISNIVLNDIKTVGQRYKITYSITYGNNKVVSAVRNIIIRDTTAPEITINKTEDVTLYYTDASNQIKFIPYSFTLNNFAITDNSGSVKDYNIEGEKTIVDYFNSLTDISNYSPKEFPIVITATDNSGNSSKKSQNIKINIKRVAGPSIKLFNNNNRQIYYNANADDGEISSYDFTKWLDDYSLNLKIESGCQIDKTASYYKYGETTKNFTEFNGTKEISIPIDTSIEGQKDLEVHAECIEEGLDRNVFPNIEVDMPKTTIKIDHADPVCDINISGDETVTVNNVTWYKKEPTVKYSLSDTNGVSGIFSKGDDETVIDGNVHDVSVTVDNDGIYIYNLSGIDVAGRSCSSQKVIGVDKTSPEVSGASSANVERSYHISFNISRAVANSNANSISLGTNNCTGTGSSNCSRCKKCSNASNINLGNTYLYRVYGQNGDDNVVTVFAAQYLTSYIINNGTLEMKYNFETKKIFNRFSIEFGFEGYASCNNYKVYGFKFNEKTVNFTSGRTQTCEKSYGTTSFKYSCAKYTNTKTCQMQGYPVITEDTVEGNPNKNFTVNFTDSGSGINGTSSKTCTASPGKTCTIDITDKVGNSKTVTCTYSKGTCS